MVQNKKTRRSKRRQSRNNVAGFPFAKYMKAAAVASAAALGLGVMHRATRGPIHNPGRGHTIATVPRGSGSKRNKTKKQRAIKKTRSKKRR